MLDVIGKKWLYFLISGLVIVPGLISLILFGLRPSLDFTGGTLLEIKIPPPKEQKIKTEDIKKITESQKIEVGSIQPSEKDTYLLRLKPITQTENQKLQNALKKKYGPSVHQERIETVGPTIGVETTQKAILSVIVASLAIVAYIAFAFRGIPKPYSSLKFGIVAIAALIHDVLVVVGVFSLLGYFYKVEVDSLFITALLTVMGFSVHDTIVVFDRIRENLRKMAGQPFATIVNESIIQTLVRSLSTSLTVVFTLMALLLFGGETIKWFVVALLVGVISGTYSSIFNAAPLLVVWEEFSRKKVK
ncbi:protein-export membrane protein SecF [Candidatus Gottesmanbacteria bacterium RIFCSPHIGHO2_01_FULL_39_10]|uniref:Protein-export membrane protein SecF n=1 Tax=Candidatus Gottesmanbacteria bacterium RIFCSPHIGHO2_01_FULL_39_10 TaxID=1798375 RepID=A0A1F5ZRP7_9BACT|nr:MAG: protein-export membrane protein SecF [Candidatus Gottesmanbacteria bacterium RIFCSPHIGHO2_01_FULL_39_10]